MHVPFDQRWDELCIRWEREGYSVLSKPEQGWLNIRELIDSVQNGGLISYFYNHGADTLPDCLAALDELNAAAVKQQVELVCSLFPGGVSDDITARNEVISSWSDEDTRIGRLLDEVDDKIMPMMQDLEARLYQFRQSHGLIS